MARRERLKDANQETRLIRRRLVVAAVMVLVLMAMVLIRLYVLQVLDYEHFATLSNANRVRLKALPPTRGLIYDRNGVVLADNLPAYRLEIIREQVDNLDDTLKRLQQYVDISPRAIRKFRLASRRRKSYESVPLLLNLSDDELARLAVNLHKFKGVEINARLTRHYPLGQHAVHVLGYVSRIDVKDLNRVDEANYAGTSYIGKLGLEKYYEKELHGKVGYQRVEVNAAGRTLRVLDEQPPVSGKNLYLTIDSRLQRLAESMFSHQRGALVAIDPNNGEVLALVSMPSFDPNLFVNGISFKDYKALSDPFNRPLFNRALTGQYPPGSTSKPFFALAGLEDSVISAKKKVFCGGYYQLPNETRKYRCWKKRGHGYVDLSAAITQSCDVYFYSLAYQLGIDRMSAFMKQFGFGSKTGVDSTSERPGLMPSREWKRHARGMPWFPGETLITGIGQGALLVTPLQLASATGALSLQGKRYRPHLVKMIETPGVAEKQIIEPQLAGQYAIRKKRNWQHVVKAMANVVSGIHGTAHRIARGLQYSIAGKTGTAQVFGIAQDAKYVASKVKKKLRDHALFIAFAPVNKPQIAVAVIVENGGHGSSVAAPIARKLMDAYLLPKMAQHQRQPHQKKEQQR